jgi:hypothetical protein
MCPEAVAEPMSVQVRDQIAVPKVTREKQIL